MISALLGATRTMRGGDARGNHELIIDAAASVIIEHYYENNAAR